MAIGQQTPARWMESPGGWHQAGRVGFKDSAVGLTTFDNQPTTTGCSVRGTHMLSLSVSHHSAHARGLLWGMNTLIHMNYLAQCLPWSEHSINDNLYQLHLCSTSFILAFSTLCALYFISTLSLQGKYSVTILPAKDMTSNNSPKATEETRAGARCPPGQGPAPTCPLQCLPPEEGHQENKSGPRNENPALDTPKR